MKKMVVMMNVHDEKSKDKIIRTVASCSGITTITMDSNKGSLTVIGEINVLEILPKLKRKWRNADLDTFGTYDPKKEAESAAAAEKKKKEEAERMKSEAAMSRSHREYPMHYHTTTVCDHEHGCVIQ